MIPSIARQSVIIKCNMQKSILTGNYEFYYAAGFLAKQYAIELLDDIRPLELKELLQAQLPKLAAEDAREQWLIQMLGDYTPVEEYDEQMKELLLWGKQEQYPWTVVIPE